MGIFDKTSDDHTVKYKVTILGDSGVGKTSILQTLCGKPFANQHVTTVG